MNKQIPEHPVRMRTIPGAYREIQKLDPETNLSVRSLRKLIKDSNIPTVNISNRTLVNLDLILSKLSCYNDDATCV